MKTRIDLEEVQRWLDERGLAWISLCGELDISGCQMLALVVRDGAGERWSCQAVAYDNANGIGYHTNCTLHPIPLEVKS